MFSSLQSVNKFVGSMAFEEPDWTMSDNLHVLSLTGSELNRVIVFLQTLNVSVLFQMSDVFVNQYLADSRFGSADLLIRQWTLITSCTAGFRSPLYVLDSACCTRVSHASAGRHQQDCRVLQQGIKQWFILHNVSVINIQLFTDTLTCVFEQCCILVWRWVDLPMVGLKVWHRYTMGWVFPHHTH